MTASWLDLLPAGLVHNLEAIAFSSDPSGAALECTRLDPDRSQLYALLAREVLVRRDQTACARLDDGGAHKARWFGDILARTPDTGSMCDDN